MKSKFTIEDSTITEFIDAGSATKETNKDLLSFFKEFSRTAASFDSGLLPLDGTGVLAIRKALGDTQIVFQHAPGMYYVNWGATERDPNFKTYFVAQPWRIVIGDLKEGNLLGARTFYSPTKIQTLDQPLYHVNLPNINCRGYGNGNGVGWICLYHNAKWEHLPLSEQITRLVERASGVEAYNDANMSGTDGPRFYKDWYSKHRSNLMNSHSYLWDPNAWVARSEKEGWQWTIEEDIWIPILVRDMDHQSKHDPDGEPLTVYGAMYGQYAAYYDDKVGGTRSGTEKGEDGIPKARPKFFNRLVRDDMDEVEGGEIILSLRTAFNKAVETSKIKKIGVKLPSVLKNLAPKTKPSATKIQMKLKEESVGAATPGVKAIPNFQAPPPKKFCKGGCQKAFDMNVQFTIVSGGIEVCAECLVANYIECKTCEILTHFTNVIWSEKDDKYYCNADYPYTECGNCGKEWEDKDNIVVGLGCTECVAQYANCELCNAKFDPSVAHVVDGKTTDAGQTKVTLCGDCVGDAVKCGCGYIRFEEATGLLGDGTYACGPCIDYKDDGTPCFISPTPKATVKL